MQVIIIPFSLVHVNASNLSKQRYKRELSLYPPIFLLSFGAIEQLTTFPNQKHEIPVMRYCVNFMLLGIRGTSLLKCTIAAAQERSSKPLQYNF